MPVGATALKTTVKLAMLEWASWVQLPASTGKPRRYAAGQLKNVIIDNLQYRLRNLFYVNQTAPTIP